MDCSDLGVRLRRQERVEVVGGLAFLDLPDRCPVGPDAGKASERAALVEREPDVAAFGLVEFAEAVERHHAAVLDAEPSRPVFALHVADIGRAAVWLHSLKSTGLPLASSFEARFLVASIRACGEVGIPHRAVASSRPSAPLRTMGAL